MRLRILAGMLLVAAVCAIAIMPVVVFATTGYVTVSASNLTDFSGAAINNATISFVPVNNQGQPISAKVGTSSGGQLTVTAVTQPVISGAFSVTLADTALTNPVNVCYQTTVVDNSTGNVLMNYPCVQPASSGQSWCTGTACDFDNYIPATPAGTVVAVGPQGPQGNPGTGSIAGLTSDGSNGIVVADNSALPFINTLPADEYRTVSNNPALLQKHWQYLHDTPVYTGSNGSSAGLDVILPNDSLWEGDWANSTCGGGNTAVPEYSQNRQAEQIRIALQAQYGYGGTGLRPLINVAQCQTTINPELFSNTGSIATSSIIGPQFAANSWYSLVQMSSGQVITWTDPLPYNQVRTYCADNTSSHSIAVAVDGSSVGTACGTTNSVAIARVATSSNFAFTTHSTTFTCATGPCFLYGVEGRLSTNSGNAGVRVHNTSVGSAPAEWFSGHTDFEDLIHDGSDTAGSAQLIIYAMGTNEVGNGISLTTYESSVVTYFTHELAKTPEAPVIVIYRPGMDSIASSSYFNWLTAYGYAHNMMVIDQTDRWGKTYTAGAWYLGNDNIHMNDGGNLDAASTILAALMDIQKPAPVTPIFGDNFLNPGVVGVTGPSGSVNPEPPGYMWTGMPGIPDHAGFYCVPTGGGTYAGLCGFFNPKITSPIFRLNPATAEVDTTNNVLDDGSGNGGVAANFHAAGYSNSQSVTFTTLAAAGSGGSFSAFACATSTGFTCTPNYGVIQGTMGTSPTTGDLVKVAWSTAWTHKAVCWLNVVDTTSSTVLASTTSDAGNSSTTQAELYSFTAPTAGHVLVINYGCN